MGLPDAAYLDWLVGPTSGAMCHLAFHGAKLVGCVFSIPHPMRIGSRTHASATVFGLTVDRSYRGLALPLVERLRRQHAERGISVAFGLVVRQPSSPSHQFWTKYARAFPRNLSLLFPLYQWLKVLAPRQVASASGDRWERLAMRVLGPVTSVVRHPHAPHVRAYRPEDLPRCAQMLEQGAGAFEWAQGWAPPQLGQRLQGPAGDTLVLERDGVLRGWVHHHSLVLQARHPVRSAAISIWGEDGLGAGESVRLIGHLCGHLHERGVQLVSVLPGAAVPVWALLANRFAPVPAPWSLAAIWTEPPAAPLRRPRAWRLVAM
ncbi:MAG: hypothetical protein IT537_09815 [Hyphomicrobiales bacterium]|nr:hypothetical protein [Hyphomicrobiales bacterium]